MVLNSGKDNIVIASAAQQFRVSLAALDRRVAIAPRNDGNGGMK
jgi:hypothetical protein|tara:strand:+ start:567 stop:698 length:132 start_codon:yes stop_codon:yes gene_type:complete